MSQRIYLAIATTLIASAIASPAAQAADKKGGDYPNRPIRIIVPFPPGGGTDLVTRTIQPGLQQRLGEQLIIDNRGSAQGITGTGIAASAVPDGYTLVIAEIGATAVAPALTPNVTFDVIRDFAPITKLIEQPYILSVHPSVAAKTLGDFIKLARQNNIQYDLDWSNIRLGNLLNVRVICNNPFETDTEKVTELVRTIQRTNLRRTSLSKLVIQS